MTRDDQIQCVLDLTARVAKKVIEEIKARKKTRYWGEDKLKLYVLKSMDDEVIPK